LVIYNIMSKASKDEVRESLADNDLGDCTKEEVLELGRLLEGAKVRKEKEGGKHYIHFSDESLGVDFTLLASSLGRLSLHEARKGTADQLIEQIQAMRSWKELRLRPDLYHNDAPDDVKTIEGATEWFREQLIHFFNTYPNAPRNIHVSIDDGKSAELDGKIDPDKLV